MQNKQTILIVDDAKENIDILVELLKEYDLIVALDGKTALEIVEAEDVDLILLDIMMPGMDGFEVCTIVQKDNRTSHIPIIFLTAKDKHADIKKGFELGAVDYITKPFNPNELLARTNTHLKLRAYEKNLERKVAKELEKNKLTQQMIHQQSKQAALGELLMHIAHQWKQPLSSLAAINTLRKIKFENNIELSQDEFLETIEKSTDLIKFMSDTVDTFIDFYKPYYKDENFSLTNSVQQVLNISDATLEYDNIKINLNSNETYETYGNANEFTQIVFSIINNARDIFKQRKVKKPELNIDIENQKVTISDNGGGIDENIMDEIFMPFKSTTNGNGVGLYIAKEIVEKNGGIISIENCDNGAMFTIEFFLRA